MKIKYLLLLALGLFSVSGAYAACSGVNYNCEQTTDTSESGSMQEQPGQVQGNVVDDTDEFLDFFFGGNGCAGNACSDDFCPNGGCPERVTD